MNSKANHDYLKICVIILTFILYLFVIGLNRLASEKIFFPNDISSLSRTYRIDITPHRLVFPSIWSIIFIWQTIWLLYAFTCLFRRTLDGSLVYRKVDIFNYAFLVTFSSSQLGIICWLWFWTNKNLPWALICFLIVTLSLYVSLYISLNTSYKLYDEMVKNNLNRDIWLVRILIQNGIAFNVTWVTIALNLNLSIYLKYEANFEVTFSSTISLCIIATIIFIYSIVENFIWQRYLVYIFTPWLVLIITLSGSLLKNYSFQKPTRNNLLTFAILVESLIFSVIKLLMCFLYHTCCKENLDKNETHRLLQYKQNKLLKQNLKSNNYSSPVSGNISNSYNMNSNLNNRRTSHDENVNIINNRNILCNSTTATNPNRTDDYFNI